MKKTLIELASAVHGGEIVQRVSCGSSQRMRETASELNAADVAALEEMIKAVRARDDLSDNDYERIFGDHDAVDRGIDAAELLAHKNSIAGVPTILGFYCWLEHEGEGDLLASHGPQILANFGPEAAQPIVRWVVESRGNAPAKCTILEGMKELGDKHPTVQGEMGPFVVRGLEDPQRLAPKVNTWLMMLAIEWQLADAAEVIERAFSANRIDCGMAGDWEDVRKQLHVEGLGLAMPAKPLNSMVEFRRNMGVGAFSQEPLHMMGEIQEEAVTKYLENACQAFARSDEGKTLLPDGGFPDSVWQFLDLALSYLGVNVENMTVADATELLLDVFPRKLSLDADETGPVIDELVAFWRFCDRVHRMEQAAAIANCIEKLRARFRQEMGDPANFGMAKGLVMAGQQAGFDMTSQEGLSEFMQAYNQSVTGRRQQEIVAAPVATRVDPSHEQSQPPSMSLKKRKKALAKLKKRKR